MSVRETKEKVFPFKCDGCGYITDRSFDLKKHRCKKAKELKCDLCEYVAKTSFNLKWHKTTVHITIPNTNLANKCEVCAYVATDSSDLLEHKKVHDEMILEGGETFPCNPICIRFK